MLHLTGRISFGVNIGNLFELERAFQCNRIIQMPPEIKEIGLAEHFLCDFFNLGRMIERPGNSDWKMRERLNERTSKLCRKSLFGLAHVKRQEKKRRELTREGLGGCDANFRAAMSHQGEIGFARGGRAHGIA